MNLTRKQRKTLIRKLVAAAPQAEVIPYLMNVHGWMLWKVRIADEALYVEWSVGSGIYYISDTATHTGIDTRDACTVRLGSFVGRKLGRAFTAAPMPPRCAWVDGVVG